MNDENYLMTNARDTLDTINKYIAKLNNIMEELVKIGYNYEMELENIDCSSIELKKQIYELKVILTKEIKNG